MSHTPTYSKLHPFLASIKERTLLSRPGSNRQTYHIVIDLKGSGLVYEPGDSLGIYPWHSEELVKKTLEAMKAKGDEKILAKGSDELLTLKEFLTFKVSITEVSGKLYKAVAALQTNKEKKERLDHFLKEENRQAYKDELEKMAVWDFLLLNEEVSFTIEELAALMMPLLPRFYSIASSQKVMKEEIHLTVAALKYESNGYLRSGVCTHFLSDLVPLGEPIVPIFIQQSHGFKLPDDPHASSLIMVGPGTGIAPFRAFLQERILHHGSTAKHWLFFGEQHRAFDFYYEDEWDLFGVHGHLDLELAFSRDQEHKVYVQHLMLARGEEIYRWLEEGAMLYVCGDAKSMAKDVEKTLEAILQEVGKKSFEEAREYIKRLRQEKRYLRDVY